jgi:hypothetical protein
MSDQTDHAARIMQDKAARVDALASRPDAYAGLHKLNDPELCRLLYVNAGRTLAGANTPAAQTEPSRDADLPQVAGGGSYL